VVAASSDSTRGRKAAPKSAYRANSGNMRVVVELSSSTATGWGDAEYAAKGGYRQTSVEQGASDCEPKARRRWAAFAFEDAKLHIPYHDETRSSYGNFTRDMDSVRHLACDRRRNPWSPCAPGEIVLTIK
jgi:hypothetical protein